MTHELLADQELEHGVLGAVTLGGARTLAELRDVVAPADFDRPSHGLVYAAAIAVADDGQAVDATSVIAELERRGQLAKAGGPAHVRDLGSTAAPLSNARTHALRIAELAGRRRLAHALEQALHATRNGGVTTEQRERVITHLDEAARSGPRFTVRTTPELATIPPPEWLIHGCLVAGGLNVLFGPSDRYKSFSAIDWALTIAAGASWFGRRSRQGAVLYIAGEGGSGLWQRVEAWAESRACDPPPVHWITEAVNLYEADEAAALEAWIAGLPAAPTLLVVDTIARCMVGGDENSTRDVGMVIASLDRIRHRFGTAVLGIHHTGHADQSRERGSSALLGAADCRIKAGGENRLTVDLAVVKVKDAEQPEPVTLHLEPVRRSLVIARASTQREARAGELHHAIRTYLDEHPRSTQNAIEKGAGMNARDVRDALMELVSTGAVHREEGSRGSYLHTLTSTASQPSDAVGRSHPGQAPTTTSTAHHPLRGGRSDAVEEPTPDRVPPPETQSPWRGDPVDHDLAPGDIGL